MDEELSDATLPSRQNRYNKARHEAFTLLARRHQSEYEELLQERLVINGWSRNQIKANSGPWVGETRRDG